MAVSELSPTEAADRLALRELFDGYAHCAFASLRYLDTFAKADGRWFFADRKLILDWNETRSLGTEEDG
jgi:hypothetical protein